MATPTKKTKYEFEPLEFSLEESTTDPDLRHAIQISHKLLSVPALFEWIEILIQDDDDSETQISVKWRTCARKLRETKVKFMPRNGKLATAWIDSVEKDGQSTLEVSVHYFFKNRLKKLREMLNSSESASKSTRTTSMVLRSAKKEVKQPTKEEIEKEIRMIIVYIGIAIFHEVAHLLIRFSGKEKTPLKLLSYCKSPDAGEYMETKAFSGIVKIFASPEKGQWSINDIYKGIGRISYTRKEKITFVFSDEWITNVYNLAYTNLKCYVVPLYMKDASSVSDTKPLKRHEEDEDDDEQANVIITKGVSEDMVDLEDLGVAKCGVHLDDKI